MLTTLRILLLLPLMVWRMSTNNHDANDDNNTVTASQSNLASAATVHDLENVFCTARHTCARIRHGRRQRCVSCVAVAAAVAAAAAAAVAVAVAV